jgi:hypothetical protein
MRLLRTPRRPAAALGAALLALLLPAACVNTTETDLRREIGQLNETIRARDRTLAEQQSTIAGLNRELESARGLSKADMEKLVHPERLVIGSLSGGDDYDDIPGHDGITLYLQPTDKDGDALKVAGTIRVELYDLANPPDENLLGVVDIPLEKARELWYGKLMTNHYTVKFPWPGGRKPAHPDVTVRASFVDFLTRRVMTAQATFTVKL